MENNVGAAGSRPRARSARPCGTIAAMPTLRFPSSTVAFALAFALAGCGDDAPRPAADAPPGFATDAPAQLAWQGVLACADCEGIDTRLTLERADQASRYLLLETFLADDGGELFREQGHWRREGALLRLQSDAGGLRVYAIEADGRLSPRDRRGREVQAGEARLLAPVTPRSPD